MIGAPFETMKPGAVSAKILRDCRKSWGLFKRCGAGAIIRNTYMAKADPSHALPSSLGCQLSWRFILSSKKTIRTINWVVITANT